MKEEEINQHWEYTLKIIKLSNGVPTLGLNEYLYKQAMKHGAKHERKRDEFKLDIMKLNIDICSICELGIDPIENSERRGTCGIHGCEKFQHFMYRDM